MFEKLIGEVGLGLGFLILSDEGLTSFTTNNQEFQFFLLIRAISTVCDKEVLLGHMHFY